MSLHRFDPEIAKIVGVNAAVIFENIFHWTKKNAANKKHIIDGKVWTYNSLEAFGELFEYLSVDQIRLAIKKLKLAGLIDTGKHNKKGYDRTTWYCVKSQMHLVEIPNGCGENPAPIPDNKPNNKHNKVFEEVWGDINPKLLRSRQGGKAQAKERFSRQAKRYGAEELARAIRSYYAAPEQSKNNYAFAASITVCLGAKELFAGYLNHSQPTKQNGKSAWEQFQEKEAAQ